MKFIVVYLIPFRGEIEVEAESSEEAASIVEKMDYSPLIENANAEEIEVEDVLDG